MRAFAYHITCGTYGTRLRYGPRRSVSRDQNERGTPVLADDEFLRQHQVDRQRLVFTERDALCPGPTRNPTLSARRQPREPACPHAG